MENASKALIIAAGILLMMLVFTLMTYIFRTMSQQTSDMYGEIKESSISEFNQQFFNYDGKENLRIQDVISIINLAKDNNSSKKFPVTVEVYLNGTQVQDKTQSEIQKMLEDDLKINNIKKDYKCKVEYAAGSKLVGKITIQ